MQRAPDEDEVFNATNRTGNILIVQKMECDEVSVMTEDSSIRAIKLKKKVAGRGGSSLASIKDDEAMGEDPSAMVNDFNNAIAGKVEDDGVSGGFLQAGLGCSNAHRFSQVMMNNMNNSSYRSNESRTEDLGQPRNSRRLSHVSECSEELLGSQGQDLLSRSLNGRRKIGESNADMLSRSLNGRRLPRGPVDGDMRRPCFRRANTFDQRHEGRGDMNGEGDRRHSFISNQSENFNEILQSEASVNGMSLNEVSLTDEVSLGSRRSHIRNFDECSLDSRHLSQGSSESRNHSQNDSRRPSFRSRDPRVEEARRHSIVRGNNQDDNFSSLLHSEMSVTGMSLNEVSLNDEISLNSRHNNPQMRNNQLDDVSLHSQGSSDSRHINPRRRSNEIENPAGHSTTRKGNSFRSMKREDIHVNPGPRRHSYIKPGGHFNDLLHSEMSITGTSMNEVSLNDDASFSSRPSLFKHMDDSSYCDESQSDLRIDINDERFNSEGNNYARPFNNKRRVNCRRDHSVDMQDILDSIPGGGEYYDISTHAAKLDVKFFYPEELASSLYLECSDEFIYALEKRPVIGHMLGTSILHDQGVCTGDVLISVNDIEVLTPEEANRTIRKSERPLKLLLCSPNVNLCVSEGFHMVKYDVNARNAPRSSLAWKPKFVVVGGVIADSWMLQMYRSKEDYDTAVRETVSKKPLTVKVKEFSLLDFTGLSTEDNQNDMLSVIYKDREWKYIVLLPERNSRERPIKIASPNEIDLMPVRDAILRVLDSPYYKEAQKNKPKRQGMFSMRSKRVDK